MKLFVGIFWVSVAFWITAGGKIPNLQMLVGAMAFALGGLYFTVERIEKLENR